MSAIIQQLQPRSNSTVRIRTIYGPLSGRSNTDRTIIKMKPYTAIYCENTAPYTGPFFRHSNTEPYCHSIRPYTALF